MKTTRTMIFITILLSILMGVFTKPMAEADVNKILDSMMDLPHKQIYKSYHYLYEKKYYINSEEGLKRYKIFKENFLWNEEENKKAGKELYGINQFTDLTFEEYEKLQMNPKQMQKYIEEMSGKSHNSLDFLSDKKQFGHSHADHHKTQQGEYDWRKFDGPVKDQETCGSCWAFATVAAIENSYHQLKRKHTQFSEQYLVDCDTLDYGCNGGWPSETITWITANGVLPAEDAPYKGIKKTCDQNLSKFTYKIVKGFSATNEDTSLFEGLISKGPLIAAMDSSFKEFKSYRPRELLPIEKPWSKQITHAVVIVAQTIENGRAYLIARNSWGSRWGYKGYFKMPLDQSHGMTDYAFLANVYDGPIPDSHPPRPAHPTPLDSVELFDTDFTTDAIRTVNDGFSYLSREDYVFFEGVRYPKNPANPPAIRLYDNYNCRSSDRDNYADHIRITQTTEAPMKNGYVQRSLSLAYEKKAEPGCVSFWRVSCQVRNSFMSLCNDVADSSGVNLDGLRRVRSMVADDSKIERVEFYSLPNFKGKKISYESSNKIFHMSSENNLWKMLKQKGGVGSIKFVNK